MRVGEKPVCTTESLDVVDEESRYRRLARSGGRLATKLAVFGSLGLFGGAMLATVVPTEVPFGPGTARATLTLDGMATVDAGVIGSLQKDVDTPGVGPVQLGANIRVNELPIQDANPSTHPIDQLSANQIFGSIDTIDINRYAEYSRATSSQATDIAEELRLHVLSLSFFVGTTALALYEFPGKKGRRLLKEQLSKPAVIAPVLLALYAGTLAVPHIDVPNSISHNWQPTGPEYDGTALDNVRISGDAANQFVNNFGSRILAYINRTDRFYDLVLENAQISAPESVLLGQRPEDAINQTMLFFTDNHCNTGTPRTLAYIASLAGADVAVDGGDSVFSGSGYERYCVAEEMRPFNELDISVVAVAGNHDSPTTSDYMEDLGAHVLDGSVQTVGGIRFLGAPDPYESPFGQGRQLRGEQTMEDLSLELAQTACSTDGREVLVVHQLAAAEATLNPNEGFFESRCSRLSLSGHTHEREIRCYDYGNADYAAPYCSIVGGTSGGAREHTPTYGPLNREAQFMLISVNNQSELEAIQDFSINELGNITIGPIEDIN